MEKLTREEIIKMYEAMGSTPSDKVVELAMIVEDIKFYAYNEGFDAGYAQAEREAT